MSEWLKRWHQPESTRLILWAAGIVSAALFLSTVQLINNGSTHPYATDIGELQNALPRWGTIHFTGYPLYTALGSLFVTIVRFVGINPAAGSSLFSVVWGVLAIVLLAGLILECGGRSHAAWLTAFLFALSTSMWVDASIAELHTMTMALSFAALLFAVRFGREGRHADFVWLVLICGQGIFHQRAFAFLGVGLLILVWPQWSKIVRGWPIILASVVLGFLTYLYLPLRAWMGADWIFSAPGTWDGFWALLLDTKAERIIVIPQTGAEIVERGQAILSILHDDWPLPLLAIGLVGIWMPMPNWSMRERWALTWVWIPHLLLCFIIWEGRISDALLAVKLPIVAMAAIGIAFLINRIERRGRAFAWGAMGGLVVIALWLYVQNRPAVLDITRDPSATETVATAARIPIEDEAITLMAPWGHDFWRLAYAQAYEDQIPSLTLVDHNANFEEIVRGGQRLLILEDTLYPFPRSWWEGRLGPLRLSSPAPGIVELAPQAQTVAPSIEVDRLYDLENGIAVWRPSLQQTNRDEVTLSLTWVVQAPDLADYSVAVHLVAADPPQGPADIISQADQQHPVSGWSPTSTWEMGDAIQDAFLVPIPPDSDPMAVRVALYRQRDDGSFENSRWFSVEIP